MNNYEIFDSHSVSSYQSQQTFLNHSDPDFQSQNSQAPNATTPPSKQPETKILRHKYVQQTVKQELLKRKNKGGYQEQNKGPHATFLYRPGVQLPDLTMFLNSTIEIRIAKEYLTPLNIQFLKRQLWGSETYTSDSDILCIMKHSGLYDFNQEFQKNNEGIAFFCKVSKVRKTYISSYKNGIKSRSSKTYMGNSLKPEQMQLLSSLGKAEDLVALARKMPCGGPSKRVKLQPSLRSQTPLFDENCLLFNQMGEYAWKYRIVNICDYGQEMIGQIIYILDRTSYKLKSQSLYLHTKTDLFEISQMQNNQKDFFSDNTELYRISKLKNPLEKNNEFFSKNNIPLKNDQIQIIFESIDWHDIQWGNSSVEIKDFKIEVTWKYEKYNKK